MAGDGGTQRDDEEGAHGAGVELGVIQDTGKPTLPAQTRDTPLEQVMRELDRLEDGRRRRQILLASVCILAVFLAVAIVMFR